MITPRLQSLINTAPRAALTADIGTDHAYVPIELVKSGMADRAVASDIRPGPLASAQKNIAAAGLSDRIETRLGPGVSVLKPGEAECIIIAGMGGELIEEIIKDGAGIIGGAALLLQPMNSQHTLRKYLAENGFAITGEELAAEGFKIYNIIAARRGEGASFEREIDLHLPPCLREHPLYGMLYAKKRREFEKIVNGLKRSRAMTAEDEEKLERYIRLLEEL